jgi:hypothetical protein
LLFKKDCYSKKIVIQKRLLFKKDCYSKKIVIQKSLLFKKVCYSKKFVIQKSLLFKKVCYSKKLLFEIHPVIFKLQELSNRESTARQLEKEFAGNMYPSRGQGKKWLYNMYSVHRNQIKYEKGNWKDK